MGLSHRQQRVVDRIRQLVEEARHHVEAGKKEINQHIPDKEGLKSVLVRMNNIIDGAFGPESVHGKHLRQVLGTGVMYAHDLPPVIGVMEAAREDLEGGYLQDQILLMAGEVFDSLLQEATTLHQAAHHDAAAVLGRVVLEDALRRLAAHEGVADSGKAATVNDELRKADVYGQPQWRQIQAWLDIGNAAAHGKFDEYTPADVGGMISGIEQFIAARF